MMYRILAVLLVLAATGCGPGAQEQNTTGGDPGVRANEIVLGTQTDLSGDLALQGAGSIDGARMRFDEVNAAGGIHGRTIRLVVDDTGSKVSTAVSAVNELIDRDHVFAMFLSLGIRTDDAALAEEAKNDVPNMYPLSGTRSMVQPESELKFTARPTYGDEVRAGVRYFLTQARKLRPCVIYDDTGYGRDVLASAKDQLAKMNRELALSVMQPSGSGDFADALDKLHAAKCDTVFLGTSRQDSTALLQAAHKMKGFDASFVGTDVDYGETFTHLDNEAGEGMYALTPMARLYSEDELSPKVRVWWNKYVEAYGDEPRLDAMQGYRAADLVVRALDAAGRNLTRKSFIKATEGIKDYTDIFGYHLTFGPHKHKGTDESVLSVVSHGRWKVVERTLSAQG